MIGLCAHSTCRSTMPACELSANDSEETMATQLSKFEPSADIMSGSDAQLL